mmetsp:Transcript_10362/g.27579  ORF Transcript_10362/g.27579 Transcript_10362/m.27579 type:complete len:88 (-) Transcript_10362:408-671(-)
MSFAICDQHLTGADAVSPAVSVRMSCVSCSSSAVVQERVRLGVRCAALDKLGERSAEGARWSLSGAPPSLAASSVFEGEERRKTGGR